MDLNFLSEMFISLAALSAGVLVITDWLKEIFKIEGVGAQITAFVVALGASVIGYLAPYGMFVEFTTLPDWQGWLYTGVVGVSAALIANGVSTYETIDKLLESLRFIFEWVLSLFKK